MTRITKQELQKLDFGSAAYVVAHAIWSEQRGRRPSTPFSGIHNPDKALAAAEAALKQRFNPATPRPTHIPTAASMIPLALTRADFDGMEFGSVIDVVAHARWAAKRGRNPSRAFLGIKNPRKALEAAASCERLADHILSSPHGPKLMDIYFSQMKPYYQWRAEATGTVEGVVFNLAREKLIAAQPHPNAEDRTQEIAKMKLRDAPRPAIGLAQYISDRSGFCGEVLFTAYHDYAVLVEGLPSLQKPTRDGVVFFATTTLGPKIAKRLGLS